MLWNPQNDFYTLYGLRDWLATRPADESYIWYDCRRCVVGKYLTAHSHARIDETNYSEWVKRTPGADEAVDSSFADFSEWEGDKSYTTMGEALKRLDAHMAKQAKQVVQVA